MAFCEGKYILEERPEIDPATAIKVMSSRFWTFGNTLYSSTLGSKVLSLESLQLLEVARNVCRQLCRSGSSSGAKCEFENA